MRQLTWSESCTHHIDAQRRLWTKWLSVLLLPSPPNLHFLEEGLLKVLRLLQLPMDSSIEDIAAIYPLLSAGAFDVEHLLWKYDRFYFEAVLLDHGGASYSWPTPFQDQRCGHSLGVWPIEGAPWRECWMLFQCLKTDRWGHTVRNVNCPWADG